jgi:GTP-binding protein
LCMKAMDFIEALPVEVEPEIKDEETGFKWDTYHKDTIEGAYDDDFDDDDDDSGVEVVYTKK